VAKARFDRPAIFGRRCPHVVDACRAQADRLRNAGDYQGAVTGYEQVLGLDPHDEGSRLAIARARLREGRAEEAEGALARLSKDTAVPRHIRDRALEDLADLALLDGHGGEAATQYRELMTRTLDEDALRNFEVKIAAADDEGLRAAVVALLIGQRTRGPDRSMAMELLGQVAAAPLSRDPSANDQGLAFYLLGRQYLNAGQYDEAEKRIDRALALPIPSARVRLEAVRLRMLIACATGDAASASRFFAEYAAHPGLSASRRGAARVLVERCTGSERRASLGAPGRAPSSTRGGDDGP
jgi:tetratricopeptide (TPR) repeat protein